MQYGTVQEEVIDILESVEAVLVGEIIRRGRPLGDVAANLRTAINLVELQLVDRSAVREGR
jgi:hypothetical protein